jgi:hypothetical protein
MSTSTSGKVTEREARSVCEPQHPVAIFSQRRFSKREHVSHYQALRHNDSLAAPAEGPRVIF